MPIIEMNNDLILYKYYNYETGIKALTSCQLGFTRPKKLNDPFELTSLSNIDGTDDDKDEFNKLIGEIRNNVAILSLSKEPLSPLMWSHYCNGYSGFVVGYEVDCDFLNSSSYNLITVSQGEVFYTDVKLNNYLSIKFLMDVYVSSLTLKKNKN